MPEYKVLKAKDVAAMLGISVRAVNQAASLNQIPCFYPLGKPNQPNGRHRRRFYSHLIEKMIKRNSNVQNQDP